MIDRYHLHNKLVKIQSYIGKMCEILSYDKIFRLSSAQCFNVYIHVSRCRRPLIGGGEVPHRVIYSAKVAPHTLHKIDFIL